MFFPSCGLTKFFDHRQREIGPNRPNYATLLIDMQSGFLNGAPDEINQRLFSAQKSVLQFCAEEDIPVMVLEYVGKGKTVGYLQQEVDLVRDHLTLVKPENDGFLQTSLEKKLQDWKATDLIVMGIHASFCVRETSNSALKNGYRLHTARDCIANACSCHPTVFDWYEKNSTLYSDSTELIKSVRDSLVSTDLDDRL